MSCIVNAKSAPEYIREFHAWRTREWGTIGESPGDDDDGGPVPPALFYVRDEKLLGGLAFRRFKEPGGEALGLWIDAVIVAEAWRGKNIASLLIREAEGEALRLDEPHLFVYTSIPQLYLNNGWVVVSTSSKQVILKTAVESHSS